MTGQFAHRRQQILKTAEVRRGGAGRNHTGPTRQHRSADTALVHVALMPAQVAGGVPEQGVMPALLMRTVVAAEHHQRVVIHAQFIEQLQQRANLVIQMLHHRRKPGDRIHHIWTRLPTCTIFSDLLVELRKYLAPFLVQLLWRMHRRVRDGCGDVAEKRLLRLHAAAHKRPRLFHHRRVQVRALLQR